MARVPKVGREKDPDLGKILALTPDLVVANMEENRRDVVEALRAAGLAVWVVFPRTVADGIALVRELGGIPSYPVLADGASPVCPFEAEPDALIRKLRERNVHAAEWIPVRNSAAVVTEYVTRMRAAGLAVTAGTEHNTLDRIPLAPACKDGPLPAAIRDIFWEGACVVAAHQFLTLHGESGYSL